MNKEGLTRYATTALRQASPAFLPLLLTLSFLGTQAVFNLAIGLGFDRFHLEFFATNIALSALLFGPGIILRGRLRAAYLLSATLLVALITTAQEIHFTYAKGFLQASALSYAHQLPSQFPTVVTLFSWHQLLYFTPFMIAAYTSAVRSKRKIALPYATRTQTFAIASMLLAVALGGYVTFMVRTENWDMERLLHPIVLIENINNFVFSPHELVEKVGIVNYYARDVIGFALRRTEIAEADIVLAREWIDGKEEKTSEKRFGIASGRNVIVVQVESLEAAVVNATAGDMPITPRLNRLACEGLYFPNYYALVGPGNTADAEFVTQNSLYPLSNTVAFIDYAHNTYVAMPKWLKQEGYYTAVMHDDVPTFWNRSNIYPKMGYDLIASKKDFIATGTPIFDHLEDREFFRQSVRKLKELPQPFMATLITLSSHTPYTLPEPLQLLQIPDDMPLTERQWHYLQSIHYVDTAIGVLIDELKTEGLYDNSLIVIFGDHGSFTGIEDVLVPSRTAPIAGDLKRNHVPLIILAPGTGLKGTRTIPGSHLDLYPTILNLLGIKEPRHTLGQDLMNTRGPVVTHRDPDARFITSILTAERYFYAGEDGSFENGGCLAIPGDRPLPLSDCRMLYERELAGSNVSDLIVKGNLLPVVTGSTSVE